MCTAKRATEPMGDEQGKVAIEKETLMADSQGVDYVSRSDGEEHLWSIQGPDVFADMRNRGVVCGSRFRGPSVLMGSCPP